jgi:hypothetical protein
MFADHHSEINGSPSRENIVTTTEKKGTSVAKRVLLVGVKAAVLEDVGRELRMPEIEFVTATGAAEVRSALRQADVDHVIVGGGLDIAVRGELVQEVFRSSDRATIHMKDQMSGPEGFGPFARAVLAGLGGYQPEQSPQAILRAEH